MGKGEDEHGMVGLDSMAGDGRNGGCGVDDSLAEKVQTQLGFLALSVEQRAVDTVGTARPRLCSHSAASRARDLKY